MSKIDMETRKKEKVYVTKEDIKRGLQEIGLKRGDIVGVHSSLSSFGYVEGGADAVIDALLETVGEEGTVVMPTYSITERIEPTPEEVSLGVTSKKKYPPYDPKTTPCRTGKIPDTFWRRKEAVRGSNPTHSLAAIGPKANELIQGWNNLLELDGYILLLGVDLGCCSSMHLAEERVQLPQRILERLEPPERLKEIRRRYWHGTEKIDIKFGVPYPDFAKMEEPCRKQGIMKITRIGEATIKLLRLSELINLYASALREKPDIFYE
jgi:aminoglycoside 3-N-acetyltransferase